MSRLRSLYAVPVLALVLAGCGAGDAPPADLASPSGGCVDAFAQAADAGERSEVEDPRSPDIDALKDTLEACQSAEEWQTAARGNPAALPLELDRETALDPLCASHGDTSVCEDWGSSGSGAGPADAPGEPSPTG